MAYKKVPINSPCPVAADRNHEWITREITHMVTKKQVHVTFCNKCSSVPK